MTPSIPFRTRPGTLFAAALLLGLALVKPAGDAWADSVVLGAGRDNTLYESPTGALSNGVGDGFFAGRTAQSTNSIRRGLVWFDVASAVPAGATITSVELRLTASQVTAGAASIGAHRVSAAWGEGASDAGPAGGSGAPSQAGDATWQHRIYPGSLWAVLGGDFTAAASAAQSIDGSGPYVWGSTPALVADVQGWLDTPASNHGWLLRGNEAAGQTVKKFESREGTTPASRPALTIGYQIATPAAPSTWGRLKGLYR